MGAQQARGGHPFLARRLQDPALRARVEAAERLGVSPRRLDGWEPVEVTEYEYDEQGRLVRAATTREPEWSEQDVAWMLALAEYRATRCPHCGGDIAVCTDPGAEDRFEVPPPHRCHAATAIAAAQERYRDSPHPQALLFRARRI